MLKMLSVEESTGRTKSGGALVSAGKLSAATLVSSGSQLGAGALRRGGTGVTQVSASVLYARAPAMELAARDEASLRGEPKGDAEDSLIHESTENHSAGHGGSSLHGGQSEHSDLPVACELPVACDSSVNCARVLVCDDETRLGDLTAGLLQECGFRAGFVPNAVLAMQYLDQHQDTSVLLLDVNLTGSQSTFELLTALAQRPKRPRVVLTSGSAKQDIRAELTHHPLVVGYLEKPYAEEELTSTITHAVS